MNIAVQPAHWNNASPMTFILRRHAARHEMLWDCYLGGQMSDADLEHEIARDPGFAHYVAAAARAGN